MAHFLNNSLANAGKNSKDTLVCKNDIKFKNLINFKI